MKNLFFFLLATAASGAYFFSCKSEAHIGLEFPQPTIIKDGEGDADLHQKKLSWLEMLHQAAPGTDWKSIEYTNFWRRHQDRIKARFDDDNSKGGGTEIIANGKLVGKWNERGSTNQAGSVFDTEYDPQTDEIWLISAGGTLFKGKRDGSNWTVINQDVRFTPGMLKFVPTPKGRRLLALIDRVPHFSDDDGLSWQSSTGIAHTDGWGTVLDPVIFTDSILSVVMLAKPSYWEDLRLFVSKDTGRTFQSIARMSESGTDKFAITQPHQSNAAFLVQKVDDKRVKVFTIHPKEGKLLTLHTTSTFGFGDAPANVAAIQLDTVTRFISYRCDGDSCWAYQSEDLGRNWMKLGLLESRPWDVGIEILPSDPAVMMAGEVHCQVTRDGGKNWRKVNEWGEYYGSVATKLHADMMHFHEFQTTQGQHFFLSSNHGGLNASYDELRTFQNIGLEGLNVSQYYTVRTDPINPFMIYAGSQDQGFQMGDSFDKPNGLTFNQVISGDYGHIVFSQNGNHLWTVYPGGWVTYYGYPANGQLTASWELKSDHESVWIPPLMQSPDPFKNEVYLAGGNAEGGAGSHIIKLSFLPNEITATNLPFDFKSNSAGGEVSVMAYSPLATNNWYAATTNGRFFKSEDAGQNWEQTINFIPEGHYLYGQAIYASKKDPNKVILGGSGYSNPPVYISRNGGESFERMDDGLPPTLVFDLAADLEEKMLFAATEAGPFVYFFDENKWYDLSGMAAPSQTYWSVEFVPDFNTVRFGTYGRGIWDFEIQDVTDVRNEIAKSSNLKIFPNPASEFLNIELQSIENQKIEISIFDANGLLKLKDTTNPSLHSIFEKTVPIGQLTGGVSFLKVQYGSKMQVQKFVVSKK